MEYRSSTSLSCLCHHMAYEGRDLISQEYILRDGSLCSLQWCLPRCPEMVQCLFSQSAAASKGTVRCSTFMIQGPALLLASGNSERGVQWVRRNSSLYYMAKNPVSIPTEHIYCCYFQGYQLFVFNFTQCAKHFGVGYKEGERKKRPLV